MKIAFHFFAIVLIATSCGTTKIVTIKFDKSVDEIVKQNHFETLFDTLQKPTIVLRVPNTSKESTQSEGTDDIYNRIEKELMKSGFVVRDRSLFSEVISKSTDMNYSNIKDKTNTDFILELMELDFDVSYKTNTYFDKDGNVHVFPNKKVFKFDGASIEFKLIHISTNDMVGYYKFNYSPFVDGKEFYFYYDPFLNESSLKVKSKNINASRPYQSTEEDSIDIFIADAISKFIESLNLKYQDN